MDTHDLHTIMQENERTHGRMMVFCLNDDGNLVEVTGAKIQIMRDELDIPIFILERE